MQILRFLNVKDESIIFTNHLGEEFKVELDEEHIRSLRSALRPARDAENQVNPREIQALLRSGLESQEVAEKLGLEIDDIARYEGPILAERKFILESSHKVEVRTAETETSTDETQFFGDVINARIETLTQAFPEWTVWKNEDQEWMLRATFSVDGEEREADWFFDHRKQALTPTNTDAINLSKQDASEKLIPNLRAVQFETEEETDEKLETAKSPESPKETAYEEIPNLFGPAGIDLTDTSVDEPVILPPNPVSQETEQEEFHDVFAPATKPEASIETKATDVYSRDRQLDDIAITRAGDDEPENDTADLLVALRKKRSKREIVEKEGTPKSQTEEVFDLTTEPLPSLLQPTSLETVDIPTFPEKNFPDTDEYENLPRNKNKKGRASIPSWDEILFGQKNEEDK